MAGESQELPGTGHADPSVLTSEALAREVAVLRDLIDLRVDGLSEILAEKFNSVETQFGLIERQRVEQKKDCVEASTPVLCADLVWRPAGQLVVGDELITCDDEPHTEAGTRTPRRFRRGVVTANSLETDDLLHVSTPRGDVVCNPQHPFLVKRPTPGGRLRYWHWIAARDLRADDLLMQAVEVWEVEQTWESGWLAGMFDGEGCLNIHADGRLARLSIVQRKSPTADLVEQVLKTRLDTFQVQNKPVPEHCAPQSQFVINRRADVMKVLGSVRPPRLLVNADRVWEGQSIGGRDRATPVLSVESAGRGTIAMLSVSTGTYIAGGFAVHNTKDAVDAALAAAKEAVKEQTTASERAIAKSEGATAEQLKTQATTTTTAVEGVKANHDDLKERVGKIENLKLGAGEQRTAVYALGGFIATLLVILTVLASTGVFSR